MLRYLLLIIFTLLISACSSSNIVYNKAQTKSFNKSDPIYLGFNDSRVNGFYFILEKSAPSNEYLLRVRWSSDSPDRIFDGLNSVIRFLTEDNLNADTISLNPIKEPKIISYSIDHYKHHEEEAIYLLTFEQIIKIANAKKVTVELSGKNINVNGYFNKFTTFKAFKNFIQNSN